MPIDIIQELRESRELPRKNGFDPIGKVSGHPKLKPMNRKPLADVLAEMRFYGLHEIIKALIFEDQEKVQMLVREFKIIPAPWMALEERQRQMLRLLG